jgi:hypothetical protein
MRRLRMSPHLSLELSWVPGENSVALWYHQLILSSHSNVVACPADRCIIYPRKVFYFNLFLDNRFVRLKVELNETILPITSKKHGMFDFKFLKCYLLSSLMFASSPAEPPCGERKHYSSLYRQYTAKNILKIYKDNAPLLNLLWISSHPVGATGHNIWG